MIPVIVGLTALVAVGSKLWFDHEAEKERKQQEENDLLRKEAKARVDQARRRIQEFSSRWSNIFSGYVLIDSNIWMSSDYDVIFTEIPSLLQKLKAKLEISAELFDEIVNLKNRPFEDPKSKRARCALARMEEFQNKKVLQIIPMGLNVSRNAYADPVILKILQKVIDSHPSVVLITDDRELRIRANQLIGEKSEGRFSALDGELVLSEFIGYRNNQEIIRQEMF